MYLLNLKTNNFMKMIIREFFSGMLQTLVWLGKFEKITAELSNF
jgi:hypothetical protein